MKKTIKQKQETPEEKIKRLEKEVRVLKNVSKKLNELLLNPYYQRKNIKLK